MTNQTADQLPLVLTMGDPAGIGLDLALILWNQRAKRNLPKFYLIACPETVKKRANRIGIEIPIRITNPQNCCADFSSALPVVPITSEPSELPGGSRVKDVPAILESITLAVEHVKQKHASALVTNPINKSTLIEYGFSFPGHTEYLGYLAEQWCKNYSTPVMLMANSDLKTVPITIHEPLMSVSKLLTTDLIYQTTRIVHNDLKNRFNIPHPRIAFAGLNPHAGENGKFGNEEIETIVPAIRQLTDEGINAFGPLSADSMFHRDMLEKFDCAMTMYHDQALIPIKTTNFYETVNITLGLPFIRTSPDHGTANSIAGTGQGNPESLATAMNYATTLARNEEVKVNASNR